MTSIDPPASPCINICELDDKTICKGCFRSSDEIMAWFTATNEEKIAILKTVATRRAQINSTNE